MRTTSHTRIFSPSQRGHRNHNIDRKVDIDIYATELHHPSQLFTYLRNVVPAPVYPFIRACIVTYPFIFNQECSTQTHTHTYSTMCNIHCALLTNNICTQYTTTYNLVSSTSSHSNWSIFSVVVYVYHSTHYNDHMNFTTKT
jgi:hypothetical protein